MTVPLVGIASVSDNLNGVWGNSGTDVFAVGDGEP